MAPKSKKYSTPSKKTKEPQVDLLASGFFQLLF
jgi:hypothetical protein